MNRILIRYCCRNWHRTMVTTLTKFLNWRNNLPFSSIRKGLGYIMFIVIYILKQQLPCHLNVLFVYFKRHQRKHNVEILPDAWYPTLFVHVLLFCCFVVAMLWVLIVSVVVPFILEQSWRVYSLRCAAHDRCLIWTWKVDSWNFKNITA